MAEILKDSELERQSLKAKRVSLQQTQFTFF